ncbi:DnaJ-domain-containing protein [Atractiella rhizophila]|nr:DnaJ-domain-containing protein [Atractiella rhizophila]
MSEFDSSFDPFKILGIPSNASGKDIKSAYNKRARETHPDKNPERTEWANEEFKKVAQAYTVLTDPEKKKEWERAAAERCVVCCWIGM